MSYYPVLLLNRSEPRVSGPSTQTQGGLTCDVCTLSGQRSLGSAGFPELSADASSVPRKYHGTAASRRVTAKGNFAPYSSSLIWAFYDRPLYDITPDKAPLTSPLGLLCITLSRNGSNGLRDPHFYGMGGREHTHYH